MTTGAGSPEVHRLDRLAALSVGLGATAGAALSVGANAVVALATGQAPLTVAEIVPDPSYVGVAMVAGSLFTTGCSLLVSGRRQRARDRAASTDLLITGQLTRIKAQIADIDAVITSINAGEVRREELPDLLGRLGIQHHEATAEAPAAPARAFADPSAPRELVTAGEGV